jgi:hypothetical protein
MEILAEGSSPNGNIVLHFGRMKNPWAELPLRCWLYTPQRCMALIASWRAVKQLDRAVVQARRYFGPGSQNEDAALDSLEQALERHRVLRAEVLRHGTPSS